LVRLFVTMGYPVVGNPFIAYVDANARAAVLSMR
jgi:hypothetical protein